MIFKTSEGIYGEAKLPQIFSYKKDIAGLEKFNKLLAEGKTKQSAFRLSLEGCSKSAQEFAESSIEVTKGSKTASVNVETFATANKHLSISSKAAALGMKALSVAANMIVGIGIGIAINALIKGLDNLVNQQEKLSESVQKLRGEYNSVISELKTLNDEVKTANTRIDELLSKDTPLTLVEQSELETLQASNRELQTRIDLLEREEQIKAKDVNKAVQKKYSFEFEDTDFLEFNPTKRFRDIKNFFTQDEYSTENDIQNQIAQYEELYNIRDKLSEKQKIEYETLKESLNSTALKFDELAQEIVVVDDETQKLKNSWLDSASQINQSLDPVNWKLQQFNDILNSKQFESVKDELSLLASQGKLTAETFNDPKYKDFIATLNDVGISAEQAATEINALNQTTNQTSVLSFALDDISNELASFNDEIAKVYSSMDLLDKAADEFANSGMISAEIFKSLSDNNLLQYLQFTSDGLSILTDDLLNNEQATKQKAQADLAAALYADLLALATNNVATAETNATGATNSAGSAAETMGQRFARSATGILTAAQALDMFNSVADGGKGGFDFKGQEQQFNKLIGNYNSAVGAIQNMGSKSDSTANSFNRMGSSAKSAADEMKRAMSSAQSAIQSLLSMTMNMLKQQYNDQKKSLQNQLDALSKRYNAEKTHLDNIAKAKKKQYDDEKKALQDELEGYRKKVNAQLELLRAKENERDYQNELLEKQKEVSDLEADLVVKGLDTSEEGIRRRLELEAQVAEKRKDLSEFQHDKSIDDQEKALNKELSDFEEKTNNKLDILDKESTRYEEMHQNRLDDIDEEYERKRERLEAQQKNIEEKVSNEAFIRSEAIKLIEDKNSGLYQKLLEWNRRYSSGVDADVTNAWNNAYSAMDQFNGAQMGVLGVLNDLALKMNDFQSATQNAASAMQGLTNAIKDKNNAEKNAIPSDWRQQLANAGGLSGTQFGKSKGFKIGGKITKNRALATNVDNEPDAVLIKAHTDEVILPKDNPRRALDLMAEFINSDVPLSNMINRGSSNNLIDIASVVNPMSNLGTSNLQNYERVNNSTGDIKIDYKFDVSGNLDNNTIPPLKKLLELASEKTINDILRQRQKSGKTRDMKSYSL